MTMLFGDFNVVLESDIYIHTVSIFSATAGVSKLTSIFYRHLALKLSVKNEEHLSVTLGLLRCHLSFALLRTAIVY